MLIKSLSCHFPWQEWPNASWLFHLLLSSKGQPRQLSLLSSYFTVCLHLFPYVYFNFLTLSPPIQWPYLSSQRQPTQPISKMNSGSIYTVHQSVELLVKIESRRNCVGADRSSQASDGITSEPSHYVAPNDIVEVTWGCVFSWLSQLESFIMRPELKIDMNWQAR